MRSDTITQTVPQADPEFLAAMERLPEPPAQAYEKIMQTLPALHDLFLKKRAAAQSGDQDAFMRIVEREMALIAEWDGEGG